MPESTAPHERGQSKLRLFYYFCRLQLPAINLSARRYDFHLQRMFEAQLRSKTPTESWDQYLEKLYPLDAFLAGACLEGEARAWDTLFAIRVGRSDRLLIDALRTRAVRLFPRDEERQDTAVTDFWGHLIVSETPGSIPILARYDGQRPLPPWLVCIFQNWQISQLRHRHFVPLPEEEILMPPDAHSEPSTRWREAFCEAARAWLSEAADEDILLLGLLSRHRLSQRETAGILGKNEGTISRQLDKLRTRYHHFIGDRLKSVGWDGEDLNGFIHGEMASLLLDEPRLSADNLTRILAGRGKTLPRES